MAREIAIGIRHLAGDSKKSSGGSRSSFEITEKSSDHRFKILKRPGTPLRDVIFKKRYRDTRKGGFLKPCPVGFEKNWHSWGITPRFLALFRGLRFSGAISSPLFC
jgi:hypothetical protein